MRESLVEESGLAAVPEALLRAAEELWARDGVDTVSLREINRRAKQRNGNAVHYHFGSREGLLAAVLARHEPAVEASRHLLLDQYEGSGHPDLRVLAGALVRPLAAKLADPDGGAEYLRICAHLYGRPDPRIDPAHLSDPAHSIYRWRMLVAPLVSETALALHQRFTAVRITHLELGYRAARSARGDDRLFVSHLIDLVAAVLGVPASAQTRAVMAPRPAAAAGIAAASSPSPAEPDGATAAVGSGAVGHGGRSPCRSGGPDEERGPLAGKVALVTGGSRGLGRAIVLALATAGADVAVVSRKAGACEEVADLVRGLSRQALAVGCHVGHWDELDGLVDHVYDHFGRVDVLVNNAGSSPPYDDLEKISEGLFDSVLGLNLKGPFRLAALVGNRMRKHGGGSIVNISSKAAQRPRPDVVPYAAAKAGLHAVTVALAQALGPTVRVNTVVPGAFRTDVSRHWSAGHEQSLARRTALGRVGEPAEITGAVLYLASDASSYTTGSLLTVDGGVP